MKLNQNLTRTPKQKLASRHNYGIYTINKGRNIILSVNKLDSLTKESRRILDEIDSKIDELNKSMKRRSDMIW